MAETPLWTRPRRSRVQLSGVDAIAHHLDRIHGARLRFASSPRDSSTTPRLTRSWVDIGPIVLDDTTCHSDVTVSADPLNKVVVVWVQRGAMRIRCCDQSAVAGSSDLIVAGQPDLPHESRLLNPDTVSVVLDPSLVAGVVADEAQRRDRSITPRFSSLRAVDRAAPAGHRTRRWFRSRPQRRPDRYRGG